MRMPLLAGSSYFTGLEHRGLMLLVKRRSSGLRDMPCLVILLGRGHGLKTV